MTKEIKSIFLVGVTLLLYGVSILISNGAFLFPYPLNPFIFLVISSQFVLWHPKKPIAWIIFFSATMHSLSSMVLWEIILPQHRLTTFVDSPWIDLFQIFYGIGIICWGLLTIRNQKKTLIRLITFIGYLLFTYAELQQFNFISLASVSLVFIMTLLSKSSSPFHLMWLLLAMLKFTTVFTLIANN